MQPTTYITQRQKQVLDMYESGLSYKEIANKLELSVNTINDYLHTIRVKQRWCEENDGKLLTSPNPPSVHIPIGRGNLQDYNRQRGF